MGREHRMHAGIVRDNAFRPEGIVDVPRIDRGVVESHESKRYGRMGRTTKGIRGVAGKQVDVTLKPLSLTHAQRAVEWEEVTFRVQRMLLEELGIEISNEQFHMENRINISDAMYRSLTGEFSEAGDAGFLPDSTPLDVKDILISLEETEALLANEQAREPTEGIDLNTWQRTPDEQLRKAIEGAKKNGRSNPTTQAAATGQSTTGAVLTEADLRPPGKAPEVAPSDRVASAAEGAAEQLSDPTADSVLFSADSRLSTVTDPKDRGKKPKTPLKADAVRFHLLEIINKDLEKKIDIYIGQELACREINSCSLVISKYQSPKGPSGRIAVLGPTRMDYSRVVSTIDFMTTLMEEIV